MSAAAIRSTSSTRRFAPTTYENVCNRCGHLVYSAEKIGPLKDFTFYHHGCFKCVVCGSKLTLKTYYNNQQDQDDKEVYCQSHVPKTGPGHLDNQAVGIKAALNVPKKSLLINEQIRVTGSSAARAAAAAHQLGFHPDHPHHHHLGPSGAGAGAYHPHGKLYGIGSNQYPAGHFDASALHIQHAVQQTKLKSNGPNRYAGTSTTTAATTTGSGPSSSGANQQQQQQQPTTVTNNQVRPGIETRINEFLDSETQRKLEMLHRDEEDALYRQFSKKRQEEVSNINIEIKEEWEKELEKLTSKFLIEMNQRKKRISNDEEKALTLKHQKEKEDLEKNMTIKLDRKKESLTKKLLEQERQATAELVEKQSKEMMNLITAKLQEFSLNHHRLANKENGSSTTTVQNAGTNTITTNNNNNNAIAANTSKSSSKENRGKNEQSISNDENKPSPQSPPSPSPLQSSSSLSYATMMVDTYPPHPPPPIYSPISKFDIYNDPSVFAELDQVAINVAREDQKTFTDLVRQLTANCVTDVEKARAIFRWITAKNLNTIKFDDNVSADTPMGILRGIKHGTESYHVLFKRLCSYVGLHCVVIKGYSKSAGYQPGVHFEDSRFRNSWNAVYVAGKWNFVQCNWSARHLVNAKEVTRSSNNNSNSNSSNHHHHHNSNHHHHNNNSSPVSSSTHHTNHNHHHHQHQSSNSSSNSNSNSSIVSSKNQTDSLRYEYDDHYFLTDPKEFIYEFFPLQPEWQLLRCPISLREFEELPFVRSLFFRYGLYFVDEDIQAILRTDSSGAVTVRIGMPSYMTPSLIFHYNLKLIENYLTGVRNAENGLDMFDGVVLKRFVMQSVTGNIVTFRVHAPCPGSFIMDIFANSTTPKEYITGEPMKFKSVCKFKIVCDELRTVMVPLPDCASGEWGPLKATRLFGLVPLTHEEALIFSPRELEIQFRMSRPLTDFMASLHRNGSDERKLSRFVTVLIDDDDDLVTFRIVFPDEGQYGLDIYTREQQNFNDPTSINYQIDKQLLTHCCKYLINVSFNNKVK